MSVAAVVGLTSKSETKIVEAVSKSRILLRSDSGGVTTLTLNRPKQFNALSQAMLGALQSELDAIAADSTIRVVVSGSQWQSLLRWSRSEGNASAHGLRLSENTL